jgi:ATP-dependent Clp protease ATP-binding subunit ClpA
VLQRRRRTPRAKTIRPAEPYLAECAAEARRLGDRYIGTENMLEVLVRNPESGVVSILAQLGVGADAVEAALTCWLRHSPGSGKIDREALAELGIDLDAVRTRLEQSFGPGALERSQASCLGICPRLKLALAYALDHAADRPLRDEHVLLGMLSVPDSVAARVLRSHGVTLETAKMIVERAS